MNNPPNSTPEPEALREGRRERMDSKQTVSVEMYEAWRGARVRFIAKNPATSKALGLEVPPALPEPGPWGTGRQTGGGWIATRVNFASPGYCDRLPTEGQFRTEAEALEAIREGKV